MPAEGLWLLLKVSERSAPSSPGHNPLIVARRSGQRSAPSSPGKNTFVQVPKRLVPLATKRNRLRRLLREATQKDAFFLRRDLLFEFKVTVSPPTPLGLTEMRELVRRLKIRSQGC